MALDPADFPKEFTIQAIRTPSANAIAALPPVEIAAYFQAHPDAAKEILAVASDNDPERRFSPSTFMLEANGGYQVGWLTLGKRREAVRWFSNLPDAATDYLLFSGGRGRWSQGWRPFKQDNSPSAEIRRQKLISVADVEGPWLESTFDSGLVERCKRGWNIPLAELTNELLATYLRQKIALSIIVPEAKKRLDSKFSDGSELYDEELANALKSAIGE